MILTPIALLDIFLVMIKVIPGWNFPWVAALIRPIYLIITTRLIRDYWSRYLLVIQDSATMVLFILVFLLYFSWIGQRLFSGTLEGVQFFSSFGDAVFNMLVCLTTSNFPDVMLPAYQVNRLNAIFFVIFLVLGLFLMMNLLLAIFYSNFKNRFEGDIGKFEDVRNEYLLEKFNEFGGTKGYLITVETFRYFLMIHCLVTQQSFDLIPDLEFLQDSFIGASITVSRRGS